MFQGSAEVVNLIRIRWLLMFIKRDSSVSIVSYYRLDDRGSISGRGKLFFLYPLCPDRLWGPPIQWTLGVKRGRGVTLTTHPHLVPRSRISRSCISSPWRLHGGSGTVLLLLAFIAHSIWQCHIISVDNTSCAQFNLIVAQRTVFSAHN
jgi:hypothetical protein